MAKVLIAYYTRGGTTEKLAQAVAAGARSVPQAELTMRRVPEMDVKELLLHDAIIFGSPVYYGSMAAEMKKLLDDSVGFHGRLDGKVGGAFATSALIGGGNETTILDLLHGLLIHGMIVKGMADADHYGAVAVGGVDDRAVQMGTRLGQNVARLAVRLFG